MATIAKGEITLSSVNDAYTVSLTPSSCTINAAFDGSNPQLSSTYGTITVKRGTKDVPFHVTDIEKSSGTFGLSFTKQSVLSMPFHFVGLSNTVLSGWVDFMLVTDDGFDFSTTVRFAFTVVRESTMLDWIQEWETNQTKIGDTYLITPKIFVGKRTVLSGDSRATGQASSDSLTGVYIGPDGEYGTSAGIYGLKDGEEIFHLNETGGSLGGWSIETDKLQSSNHVVNILAEGSIYAIENDAPVEYWGLYSDGHAVFASGNVKFYANGDAEFAGTVNSKSGNIGGWTITENKIRNSGIILDASKPSIGCYLGEAPDGTPQRFNCVEMYYTSNSDYGIIGKVNAGTVFQLGSTNKIGNWNFNNQAIWTGSEEPDVTAATYTEASGNITIAPNGLRGYKWYVDADGTAAFAGGSIKFDTDKAEAFGWLMRTDRFSSAHAALSSSSTRSGLFLCIDDISEVTTNNLVGRVGHCGGIYMYADSSKCELKSYDTNRNVGFCLTSTGENTIGNWSFDHESIYIGTRTFDDNGFTQDSGSMVLATTGLIGNKWQLLADGSGKLAGGKISWLANGTVTLASDVNITWGDTTGTIGTALTNISSSGIYTGNITAEQITSGTIDSSRINADELLSNGDCWALLRGGNGWLANKQVEWDTSGNLTIKCSLTQNIHLLYQSDAQLLSTDTTDGIVQTLRVKNHLILATQSPSQEDKDLNPWPYAIYSTCNFVIELPIDASYIGKEVVIYDLTIGPFSRTPYSFPSTKIKPESGGASIIGLPALYEMDLADGYESVSVMGGFMKFVGIPSPGSVLKTRWMCIGYNGIRVEGTYGSNTYQLSHNFGSSDA